MKKTLKFIFTSFFTYLIKRKAKRFGQKLKVNKFSTVTNKTTLGNNVNFNGIKITGKGNIEIGDNFHSGEGCYIISSFHNYEGSKIPYDKTEIVKDVMIKDNVWIGINVIILAGVTIGEGAIIQAGSVVVNDIPNYAIAGGHPAKVFSSRDELHYLELKKMKDFF